MNTFGPPHSIADDNRQSPAAASPATGDGAAARDGQRLSERPVAQPGKRAMDLVASLVLGLLAAPLMLLIAIGIRLSSPGPVLFAQERIGRGGQPFRMWKFRTMLPDAEHILDEYLAGRPDLRSQWEADYKLADDPRVIPAIGNFLRRSSLDELPQLWNVLVGEMSVVGPRPLPPYHLDQFDAEFQTYRGRVTPGITCLWQLHSRGNGSPEMFAKWDSAYIEDWSLALDVSIVLRTVVVVVFGTGS